MAHIRWRGGAPAVAQVDTITPANVQVGDVFRITINSRVISYTAAAATVADVTAGLVAAWATAPWPECAEVTAADNGTDLTLTANEPGIPFVVTTSTTDGGGNSNQTLSKTTTTGSAGPNHWNTAANWVGGALPATNDTVWFDEGSDDILYGLDQSSLSLAAINITRNFTGRIGLPSLNPNGYPEYRTQYATFVQATTITIGEGGTGEGSRRIKIDTGGTGTTFNVRYAAPPESGEIAAVFWKGIHNSNAINVTQGTVAIALLKGELATLGVLRTYNAGQNFNGDAIVYCGPDVTFSSGVIDMQGGTIYLQSTCATITMTAGFLHVSGAAACTTLEVEHGECWWCSTGTITTAHVGTRGVIDLGHDPRQFTFFTCNMYAGATLRDPHGRVAWSTGVRPIHCKITDVTLDLAPNITFSPSNL